MASTEEMEEQEIDHFAVQPKMKIWGSFAVLFWVFQVVITAVLFRMFFTNKAKAKKIKGVIHTRLGIALFTFELISGVCFIWKRTCANLRDYLVILPGPVHEIEKILGPFGGLCMIISFQLILFTFLARLYTSFRGTAFAYSKCFYIFIFTEILFVGIFTFFGAILGKIAMIAGGAIVFVILNCIGLTILFIHSLKKVLKLHDDPSSNGHLESIMVKFLALMSLAMITSFFLSFFMIIGGLFHSLAIEGLILVFQPIDSSLNVLCIFLQFRFNKEQYMKWLRVYHNFVLYLFTKQTADETNLVSTSSAAISSQSPPTSGDEMSHPTVSMETITTTVSKA